EDASAVGRPGRPADGEQIASGLSNQDLLLSAPNIRHDDLGGNRLRAEPLTRECEPLTVRRPCWPRLRDVSGWGRRYRVRVGAIGVHNPDADTYVVPAGGHLSHERDPASVRGPGGLTRHRPRARRG